MGKKFGFTFPGNTARRDEKNPRSVGRVATDLSLQTQLVAGRYGCGKIRCGMVQCRMARYSGYGFRYALVSCGMV